MEKLSELEELIRLIRILLGTVWGKAGRTKKNTQRFTIGLGKQTNK